ncbi:hypothetical protein Tco_0054679, partial [Tanacetum coccineum]
VEVVVVSVDCCRGSDDVRRLSSVWWCGGGDIGEAEWWWRGVGCGDVGGMVVRWLRWRAKGDDVIIYGGAWRRGGGGGHGGGDDGGGRWRRVMLVMVVVRMMDTVVVSDVGWRGLVVAAAVGSPDFGRSTGDGAGKLRGEGRVFRVLCV